jgi:hypothetical protein
MGISTFPAASGGSTPVVPLIRGWAATGSGSYNLTQTLPAGIYHIECTVTTQTSNVIGFVDSEGITWNATINGGVGFVSLPRSASTIVMPSPNTGWTYPMSVSIYTSTQAQPAALTNTSITWAADKSYVTGSWDTVPTGVTGVSFYWTKQGVTYSSNFNSVTSGAATAAVTSSARPAATTAGIAYTLVPYTANGVYGLPATGTTGAVPSATVTESFTSSTSWVAPITGTLTEVLIVGGGGSGGSAYYAVTGGGGGAGGYRTSTSIAVTSGTTYTITVGGAQSQSGFGSFTTNGGGNGGSGGSNNAGQGASGGGGSGTGGGPGGPGYAGASGNFGGYSPVEGYAGGSGVGATQAGGGGGASGVGLNAPAEGYGGPGTANSITGTSVTYSVGGPGGGSGRAASSTYGSGAKGTGYGGSPGSTTPQPGFVAIKYTF